MRECDISYAEMSDFLIGLCVAIVLIVNSELEDLFNKAKKINGVRLDRK